jgi:hypothetical protein
MGGQRGPKRWLPSDSCHAIEFVSRNEVVY